IAASGGGERSWWRTAVWSARKALDSSSHARSIRRCSRDRGSSVRANARIHTAMAPPNWRGGHALYGIITHRQNRGDLCHHRSDTIRDIMLAWAVLSSTMGGSYWCAAPHGVAAATGRWQGGLLRRVRASNKAASGQ